METKLSKTSPENNRIIRRPIVFEPSFTTFFSQVTEKFQNFLQSQLKSARKNGKKEDLKQLIQQKEHKSATDWVVNLEKQLHLWRENPVWGDKPPEIKVSVPKGSLCNLYVQFDVGLPPDAVYNIVTDPGNKRVFKNIKEVISRKVLVDEGSRQVIDLDQAAIWRFLWWSGTISVHVLVDQNRDDHSMKFKQAKAGFMKKFEGCWRVEPVFVDEEICFPIKPTTLSDYHTCTQGKGRIGSRVSLEQLLQPAIVPPPPISWYLRGITSRTTEMLINDLIAEVERVKGDYVGSCSDKELGSCQDISHELKVDDDFKIKERWASRRRNARQCRRNLPP